MENVSTPDSTRTQKNIFIIRHGETDLNKQGIVQGRGMDTNLNETGLQQARAFYAAYRHIKFDKIYTSSLKRTHQTVQLFIQDGIPWVQYPGLDELAWGVYEGLESTEETKAAFRQMLESWQNGELHMKFENGESPLEVKERQLEILERLIECNDDQNILICMHGRAMRLFLCILLNLPLSKMEDFPHMNTTLYKLVYDGYEFRIEEFNNTDHLNNVLSL